MVGLERLGVEHVEAGVADAAARSASISAASSTSAPRAVLTRMAPGLMRASRAASRKPRVSSVSDRLSEMTSERRKQSVECHLRHPAIGRARCGSSRSPHADAGADAGDLAADAAKADDAERLAEQLHAFERLPGAGANLAVGSAMSRAQANISAIVCSATAVSP